MQVVDRIASSGYNYVAPSVDRACSAVPLLGGLKQRIEPYAPPLIQKADLCIDLVYGVLEVRATALRGAVRSTGNRVLDLKGTTYTVVEDRTAAIRDVVITTGNKVQKRIGENMVVVQVHKTSLALVDTLDMLIDRYLPEPEDKDRKDREIDDQAHAVITRMLHIPFKIPARVIKITIAKTYVGFEVVQVRIKWAIQLTTDQKVKLQAVVVSKSQAIADKVSSSSPAVAFCQRKHDASKLLEVALHDIDAGRVAVKVKCHSMCERLHVIEARDWALEKADALQHTTLDRTFGIFAVASKRVYDVTSFVVGEERVAGLFALVSKRLPFVKNVTHASAPAGDLSDSSLRETDPKCEASSGEAVKTSAIALVMPSKEGKVEAVKNNGKTSTSAHDEEALRDTPSEKRTQDTPSEKRTQWKEAKKNNVKASTSAHDEECKQGESLHKAPAVAETHALDELEGALQEASDKIGR